MFDEIPRDDRKCPRNDFCFFKAYIPVGEMDKKLLIMIIQLGKGTIKRRLLGLGSSTRLDLHEKPHVPMPPGYFRVDRLGIPPPCSSACQNLG